MDREPFLFSSISACKTSHHGERWQPRQEVEVVSYPGGSAGHLTCKAPWVLPLGAHMEQPLHFQKLRAFAQARLFLAFSVQRSGRGERPSARLREAAVRPHPFLVSRFNQGAFSSSPVTHTHTPINTTEPLKTLEHPQDHPGSRQ